MSRSAEFSVGSSPVPEVDAVGRSFVRQAGLYTPAYDRAKNAVMAQAPSRELAVSHERQPRYDPQAEPAYKAMGEEVNRQYDHLTKPAAKGGLGIDVEVTKDDPYGHGPKGAMGVFHEMRDDVQNQGKIKIFSSHTTGGHPYFSDDQNDRVRAVHEVFGHLGSGRGVDKHGEEAAYQKHASMFTPLARRAAATEFRGQVAYYWKNKQFPDQRMALHPEHMSSPQFAEVGLTPEDAGRARRSNEKQGVG